MRKSSWLVSAGLFVLASPAVAQTAQSNTDTDKQTAQPTQGATAEAAAVQAAQMAQQMKQQAAPPTPPPANGGLPNAVQPPTQPQAQPQTQTPPSSPISLTVAPPSGNQAVGSTFQVTIAASNARDLYAVPLQLQFNPAVLQLVNVDSGDLLARDGQAVSIVHRDEGNGLVTIST